MKKAKRTAPSESGSSTAQEQSETIDMAEIRRAIANLEEVESILTRLDAQRYVAGVRNARYLLEGEVLNEWFLS